MSGAETKLTANGAQLTITAQGGLHFRRAGGEEWSAGGPLLILKYYDRQHPRAQLTPVPFSTDIAFGTAGTLSLAAKGKLRRDGVTATTVRFSAEFPEVQIVIPFEIVLNTDGSGFAFRVNFAQIVEDHPRLYRIMALEVFPNFGAAQTGESGFLTLPNWIGTQMFFNKTVSRELRQSVYSSNDQWEYCCNAPVFGITRAQGTLCGIIAAGDTDANLICRQHWEEQHLNGVHPELVFRWAQEDDAVAGPREVRYTFAGADYSAGEGYVFCGREYRRFLRAERGLQTWEEKGRTRPEAIDYRDRFFLKIFMGYKEPHPEGKGEYHSTCTFAETREILQDLLDHGVRRICATLVGWNIDGHDGMPPTRFPVDERLGGEQGMRELIAWCKARDIMLCVHDSYGASYTCSQEHNIEDLIFHRSGEYWESVIWSGGQAHRVCPSVYLEKYVKRDIPMIAALGVHGHHHLDAVGSFMPCFNPRHPLKERSGTIACNREMFRISTQIMGSVSTEMPFGPYFDVIDGIFHCYLHPSAWHLASPAHWFYDRSVPLLPLALHGSVRLQQGIKEQQETVAEMAGWGIAPQWEVASRVSPHFGITSYAQAKEKLIRYYHLFYGDEGCCLNLEGREMLEFHEVAPGVTATMYEGGLVVLANDSAHDYQNLAPGEFRVQQG